MIILLSGNVIKDLAPALIQTFATIMVGYLFGRFKFLPPEAGKIIGTYEWPFFFGILIAKSTLFVLTVLISLFKLGLHPKGIANAGIFAIFVTQSNDFAMGLPILQAVFANDHPDYPKLLFIIAPISLVLLNPIGFLLMEYGKAKTRQWELVQQHMISDNIITSSTPKNVDAHERKNEGSTEQLELTPTSSSPHRELAIDPYDTGRAGGEEQESSSEEEEEEEEQMDEPPIIPRRFSHRPSVGTATTTVAADSSTLDINANNVSSTQAEIPSTWKMVGAIFYNVFTNPVVVCTLLGVAANFAFNGSLPDMVDSFFLALGNSFSATALFVLGLGISGNKLRIFNDRTLLFLPLVLIIAKLLVFPILIRLIMVLLKPGDQTSPLILCAFIVGTIPTAPSVVFFATQFQPPALPLIGPSMILCTFVSAPLMFVSDQVNTLLSDTTRISSGFGFVFAVYLLVCLIYNHRYHITRDRLLIFLVMAQAVYCGAIQLCVLDVDGFAYGFRYNVVLIAQFSVRLWLAVLAIHEIIRTRQVSWSEVGLLRCYIIGIALLLFVIVGIPQMVANTANADLTFCQCWNQYGRTQWAITLVLLIFCFLAALVGLVALRSAPKNPAAAAAAGSSVTGTSTNHTVPPIDAAISDHTFGFTNPSFRPFRPTTIDTTPFLSVAYHDNQIQEPEPPTPLLTPSVSMSNSRYFASPDYEGFWSSSMQVFYILNLFSMFLSIALQLWDTDTNGIRIELMLFDAVLFSIHGCYTYALFGLTPMIKSPIKPLKRRLKKMWLAWKHNPAE